MKNISLAIAAIASLTLVSCFDTAKPNYQYMPNMYEPVGYETYGEYGIFPNDQAAMLPAEGSIPRGWQPYDYKNTTADLELAKDELMNPLPVTEENLAKGKELYDIYCGVCHGDKGDGQGILMKNEVFLGIPSYADPGRKITDGGVYHVQMYGLNSMGSYASQTSEEERWQITHHVMNLKAALLGEPERVPMADVAEALSYLPSNDTEGEEGEEPHDEEHEDNNH
ncbi:c-type cytochrome [Aureitalea marina]|uniref:Cytochrome C n=1 Tax=Aureitalea marina TaxID=930804 RepID=A0A2S7KRE3_9FLAO|nr:cytochrome c [Aureitalea marina]PQB05158.1 cytochrome C [Aureitalea marina]